MHFLTKRRVAILLIIAVLFAIGCKSRSMQEPTLGDLDPDSITVIPFPVKEPEIFSAEIIVKSMAGKVFSERKYFVAKNGEMSFESYGVGEKSEFSILRDSSGITYRLNPAKKEFQKLERSAISPATDSISKSLTSRWLNEKHDAEFVDLGRENGLKKYQIKFKGTKNTEILIFIDEQLKYPVLQQFFSVVGKKRKLEMSVELRNITTKPAVKHFALPAKYKEATDN